MQKNLVVVGGGFAGMAVVHELEHSLAPDWGLTLLSQENFMTFNPLLPEVVGASVLPGHVVAPHRQMVHCSFVCMAKVWEIDTERRRVHYLGEGGGIIDYDQLVLACGSNANLDIVKGMSSYALPLKTLGDALFLRNRIIARLEQAEVQPDEKLRRWLTSFVVVGGGFSGAETAGALADFIDSSLRYYKRLRREDIRIMLIHSGDHLLPELDQSLGRFAEKNMLRRGIEIMLNARAVRVTDQSVELNDGASIESGTVICTIGTQTNPLIDQIPSVKNRGRLVVNPDMSVPGCAGVWAVGDCAAVVNSRDGGISPPTAQFAEAQGRHVASNILKAISGQPTTAFRFKPKGQLASVGHNKAVAQVFGLRLSGFVAWLLWRGLYLIRMPTFSRKARLYLEWNWAMFFPPDISHFGYRRTARAKSAAITEVITKAAS